MIEDGDTHRPIPAPIVTWTIVALNVLIYIWDRQGHLFGTGVVFADLVMRPREVVIAGLAGPDRFPLVTLFTSMFLHGNIGHIVGNMVFLLVFGPGVEQALGSARF